MNGYYEVYHDEHFHFTIERFTHEGKHVVNVHEDFPVITPNEVKWVHNNWYEEFETYEAAKAFFAHFTSCTRPVMRKMEFAD